MASKPFLIRVVGSLNVDFTTVTGRFPGPGETLTAKALHITPGGKGANQAVACGRATKDNKALPNVRVEMVGAVGAKDPYYASLLKPTLEESGVNCDGISEVEHSQTGTATIIVDEGSGGENRILLVPGANHDGMSDKDAVLDRTVKEPRPQMVILQGEIPRDTVLHILAHFKAEKDRAPSNEDQPVIILNPAPVYPDGIPTGLLGAATVLIVNETEMLQLARGTQVFRDSPDDQPADFNEDTLAKITSGFHGLGVPLVLVTLGARGVYYSSRSDGGRAAGLKRAQHVEHVVETTGAGDTFVGYAAAEVAKSRVEQAGGRQKTQGSETFGINFTKQMVEVPMTASALCIQRSGAMQSIPWAHEI